MNLMSSDPDKPIYNKIEIGVLIKLAYSLN